MGLTKDYLRFVPGAVFGVIGNSSGNVLVWKSRDEKTDLIAVGACENVVIWNDRKGEKEMELRGDKHPVSTLAHNGRTTQPQLAAGYRDGVIRLFSLTSGECVVKFSGHRTSVSCLSFDEHGFLLASGGMDTDIIVWDIVDETGLCRLKGHSNAVTQVRFLKQKSILVSSSKDGFIKFWNLDMQHCFKTVVGDQTEFWDFLVINDSRIFAATGGGDKISVYNLTSTDDDVPVAPSLKRANTDDDDVGDEPEYFIKCVASQQEIPVANKGKRGRLSFAVDKSERIFGYHTFRKTLNLFKILNPEEIKKKIQRTRRKVKKQSKLEGEILEDDDIDVPVTLDHKIEELKPLKFPHVIVSFACQVEKGDVAKLVVLFRNNTVSSYSFDINDRGAEAVPLRSLFHSGHRTDVKTVAFSSDSVRLLSASQECVKLWNRDSQQCVGTLECESAVCSTFAFENSHCLIGTKSGKIQILEIGPAKLLEDVEAHDGEVACLCLFPNRRGLVTGGSDKDVKFWEFDLIKDEEYSLYKKRLTLSLQRTLKMPNEVLCVKFSPTGKMLAISLLDNKVRVLFADSFKLAFELYGHKMPVRCMDISYDDALIVTGSDDRSVKIWSMEFGSCNKSLFAHAGEVKCIEFLPKTHMFFSAGTDHSVKQWDADNFQKIITLEGHHDVIDALTISPDGMTVVSASRDRSLRLWDKTDELLVLSEEQELEQEATMEKAMGFESDPAIPGEYNKDVSLPSKKTPEVTKAADQLIEALDVYREETLKLVDRENQCKVTGKDLPPIPPHPLFVAFSAESPKHYMLAVLRRIKNNDRKEALLLLPFDYAVRLLEILADLASRKWGSELVCNCIQFLLRIHFTQLSSSPTLYPLLERLRFLVNRECSEIKDMYGFVLAGLNYLVASFEEEETPLFVDKTKRRSRKKKKCLPVLKSV